MSSVQTQCAPRDAPDTQVQPPPRSRDADYLARRLQQGLNDRSCGDYDKALAEFTSAIALEPAAASAYAYRGEVQRLRGAYNEALADLGRALQLDPTLVAAYVERGLLLCLMGRPDRAIADYSAVLAREPRNAVALTGRGLARAATGDYDRAFADYGAALAVQPAYFPAYLHRGKALSLKGDYGPAIADFTQVLATDANNAQAYTCRGNAHRLAGCYERAIADYTAALALQPHDVVAHLQRGHAQRLQGTTEQAVADYTEALRLDPANAEAYAYRGLVYRQQRQNERALADLDRALQLDRLNVIAYYNRGRVHAAMGDRQRATADYEQALLLQPQFATGYLARALLYDKAGQLGPALRDCDAALRVDPRLAPAYYLRGTIRRRGGQHAEASADFSETIRLDPAFALAYLERAWIHANRGDYAAAAADLSEAIQRDPHNALAHASRGLVGQLTGNSQQAVTDWSRACALAPRLVLACWCRGLARTTSDLYEATVAAYTEGIRPTPTSSAESAPVVVVPNATPAQPTTHENSAGVPRGAGPADGITGSVPQPAPGLSSQTVVESIEETIALAPLEEVGEINVVVEDEEEISLQVLAEPSPKSAPASEAADAREAEPIRCIFCGAAAARAVAGNGRVKCAECGGSFPNRGREETSRAAGAAASLIDKLRSGHDLEDGTSAAALRGSDGVEPKRQSPTRKPDAARVPTSGRRVQASAEDSPWRRRKYAGAGAAVLVVLGLVALPFHYGSAGNRLYPVSGTVTYKGAPAAGAVVEFRRPGSDPLTEQAIMGLVGQDGTFTIACGQLGTGAPPGEYDVLIKWPDVPSGRRDRNKERYADPKHPRLHAVVKAEANTLAPFELEL